MKSTFDRLSVACSKMTTHTYSTSFSLGIYFLSKKFHGPIYSIYGFVRLADEIVDSFHGYKQERLLEEFKVDTYAAIEAGISLNPVLNAFQQVVHDYNIEHELIDQFLFSMAMDLNPMEYDQALYEKYILGSAEVVGLMCLRVFTENNTELYEQLKPAAMRLGSAFQKVNFLRDLKADYEGLGRTYFPGIDLNTANDGQKAMIESDIKADFDAAFEGIQQLPRSSGMGVYLAYIYYRALFRKIKGIPLDGIMNERVRVPNSSKFGLMLRSLVQYNLKIL